jgi:acetyl esterase/lipase
VKRKTRDGRRAAPALAAALSAALLIVGCEPARAEAMREARPPEVIRVWPGAPSGTESWTGSEVELDAELPGSGKVHIVTNVTLPTLTIFRPPPGRAKGTAMLILPGGAFRALAWDLEGTEIAQWLTRRGITAFVLKYRVRPPGDSAPSGPESFDDFALRTQRARALTVADARQALAVIRANGGRFGLAADRVGMIGFSAGAMTMMSLAVAPETPARPDFVVSVYGAILVGQAPPPDAPPLFVVAAQDDPQVPFARSIEIFERWSRARRPAELHLYEKGGHGFGIRPHGLPADSWPAALEAWLVSRGLVTGK